MVDDKVREENILLSIVAFDTYIRVSFSQSCLSARLKHKL